jgi:hypothetical protein
MSKWTIDHAALEAACEELGLEPEQVDIKYGCFTDATLSKRGCAGRYGGKDSNGRHVVQLLSYLDTERASRVLWHELMHVAQCERDAGGSFGRFFVKYRAQLEAAGIDPEVHAIALDARYRDIPYEREARLASLRHYRLPLTRTL